MTLPPGSSPPDDETLGKREPGSGLIAALVPRLPRLPLVMVQDFAGGQLSLWAMSLAYSTLLSLVPLLAVHALAARIIPANTAYTDVSYAQALKLSTAYQGGVVAWVAFWAFYGAGFGAENLANVAAFGGAYLSVILIEPVLDLGVLAVAKTLRSMESSKLFHTRMYHPAI